MSEQEIYWLGRAPATAEQPGPSEDPAEAEMLAAACETAGWDAERFVAAQGPWGSWLFELRRAGRPHRLIWNARAGRMSLEAARPGGAWDELRACEPGGADLAALLAGLRGLLTAGDGGRG